MLHTEEVLDKLNKRELNGMILSLQNEETENNDLKLDKIRKLNDKFSQPASKNLIIKQANSLLSK